MDGESWSRGRWVLLAGRFGGRSGCFGCRSGILVGSVFVVWLGSKQRLKEAEERRGTVLGQRSGGGEGGEKEGRSEEVDDEKEGGGRGGGGGAVGGGSFSGNGYGFSKLNS
ncbi:glycine-rich RNA-binding protein 1-like [Lotus japonicus]|uniref:glycine-rich RNA-binding protein 1-like n=1 Tax=Lotus japonicus TaxID=34305 RepID=UPI00259128CB|nr:glycine-rich RNA-binding protein 1-like [Lotus japonicus]